MKTALVLGAGGFIGSHMVRRLKVLGYWVRGVDLKYPEFSKSQADEFLIYDLTDDNNVSAIMRLNKNHRFSYYAEPFENEIAFDEVYQFAADMGGAGYVFSGDNDAAIMSNSAQINLHVTHHAIEYKIGKLFYSSSACIYPQELQKDIIMSKTLKNILGAQRYALKESDAYPANPDSDYGWEKLFSERLYLAYARNYGLNIRIARFHNIYGPEGAYQGGKEKALAAICRKAIEAARHIEENHFNGAIMDIWGDGEQSRSFLYIDDCIDAVRLLMESEFKEPINIGSEEMVSINRLADMAIELTGKSITKNYVAGPQGVRGRNSDNTLITYILGWKPSYSLKEGLKKTNDWLLNRL